MKKMMLVLALFAGCVALKAQSNLGGTWKFENQESISGKLYSNGSPKQVVIKSTDKMLTIQSTAAGMDGNDVVTTTDILLSGSPSEMKTASGRKKVVTLTANPNGSYTAVSKLYNAADPTKLEMIYTDTWSIENGQLVLQRKADNATNGEVWESKAFYSKQ